MTAFTGTPQATLNIDAFTTASPKVAGTYAFELRHWEKYTHTATEGSGTGEVDLILLPPGRLRIYPDLSRIVTTQFGASADLHLGYRAYTEPDGDAVVEDDNAFLDNADAGGGALDEAWVLPAVGYLEVNTKEGLQIFAMIDAGNIEADDTIEGWVAFTRVG